MADDKKQEFDWSKTCWSRRFCGVPCLQKATWRGPGEPGTIRGMWRACDEHRLGSDVRIEAIDGGDDEDKEGE